MNSQGQQKNLRQNQTTMNKMYHYLFKPFLQPFYELFEHFAMKMWLALLFLAAWIQVPTGLQEVEVVGIVFAVVPVELLVGLNLLIAVDFISGVLKASFDPAVQFRLRKWVQTAYKITAYNGAALTVAVTMSMFPEIYTYAQYIFYVVLSGNELWSILRNLRLTSLAFTAIRIMRGKTVEGRSWGDILKEEMARTEAEEIVNEKDK